MYKDEKHMNKHAYLIMAHKQPELLNKLLRLLDNEKNDFYIHIDKKSNMDMTHIGKDVSKSNIYFIDRISVNWGGYSQIQCEMNLLKSAVRRNYSYYHLLSGFDLPLKDSDYIYDFFESNKGKEFISFEKKDVPNIVKERVSLYYPLQEKVNRKNYFFYGMNKVMIIVEKLLKINRLKNTNLVIQKGANWFDITHDFAEYVVSKEQEIKNMYKSTFCADEIFLQTLFVNSRFKNNLYYNVYDDNPKQIMRYIDWNRGNPYVFRENDFNDLIESEFLFARKFDEDIDEVIIDNIYHYLKK